VHVLACAALTLAVVDAVVAVPVMLCGLNIMWFWKIIKGVIKLFTPKQAVLLKVGHWWNTTAPVALPVGMPFLHIQWLYLAANGCKTYLKLNLHKRFIWPRCCSLRRPALVAHHACCSTHPVTVRVVVPISLCDVAQSLTQQ
jgi:hypothetical protein